VDANHTDTDVILFRHIKSGDEQALEVLFTKYYRKLCAFAYFFVKNKETAEELVADVFIKIWQKRQEIDISSNVQGYLYKVTRNQALAYLQKTNHQHNFLSVIPASLSVDVITPEDNLIAEELTHSLDNMVQTLPDHCRLIFQLHKNEGLKYKEIAGLLQISVKTVENQMGKALKYLRKAFVHQAISAESKDN
jgi:RNA polymerase sigma-70 factor, ECF subfamily